MKEVLDIALNLLRSGYDSINFDESTIRAYFEKLEIKLLEKEKKSLINLMKNIQKREKRKDMKKEKILSMRFLLKNYLLNLN